MVWSRPDQSTAFIINIINILFIFCLFNTLFIASPSLPSSSSPTISFATPCSGHRTTGKLRWQNRWDLWSQPSGSRVRDPCTFVLVRPQIAWCHALRQLRWWSRVPHVISIPRIVLEPRADRARCRQWIWVRYFPLQADRRLRDLHWKPEKMKKKRKV